MNRPLVDRIADAVMYEGYILYPYRPSTKNHRRWTFGGLFPESYRRPPGDSDRSSFQAECPVRGDASAAIDVRVRFLHLASRQVGAIEPALAEWPGDGPEPASRPVESLRVGDRIHQTWQEAEEREIRTGSLPLGELAGGPWSSDFAFPGGREAEPIRDEAGAIVGAIVRDRRSVVGRIELEASEVGPGAFRVTLRVACRSPLRDGAGREEALLQALVSTHAIFEVRGGAFVSLVDPPEGWREVAAACENQGVWPVLVGGEGTADTVLASPIILYDDPQIAPESPGDLFDGLEIDEILSLRILTLTDDEKAQAAAVDARAGALLARTEAMAREELSGLHGGVRGMGVRESRERRDG